MQKPVELLEKYVEWIAIGLGGVFFLFMIYQYILMPVSATTSAGTTVRVDNVDQKIADGSIEKLKILMTTPPPPDLKFDVADFKDAVIGSLQNPAEATQLAEVMEYSPYKLPDANAVANDTPKVTELPQLPPADFMAVVFGRTQVLKSQPGAGGAAAAQAVPQDIDWSTSYWRISFSKLNSEWTRCFGPGQTGGVWKIDPSTEFLSATIYREEKPLSGSWSQPVEVARLWNNELAPYPSKVDDQRKYQAWAKDHAVDILTPPFPQLAPAPYGNVPLTWPDVVRQIAPNAVNQPVTINPGQPGQGPAAPKRSGTGTRMRRVRNSEEMGGGPAPSNPTPPETPATPASPTETPPQNVMPRIVSAPGIDLTVQLQVLNGGFNPGLTNQGVPVPDYMIALHDGTLRSGVSYRYSLKYKLLNPLFDRPPTKASKQEWVQQFDLESPMSAPGALFTPEALVKLFCAGRSGDKYSFEVRTQAQGKLQKLIVKVHPGDAIGGINNNVDFSTGYTFVELKTRNNRDEVILLDPSGNVEIRDPSDDAKQMNKPPVTPGATPPATPG